MSDQKTVTERTARQYRSNANCPAGQKMKRAFEEREGEWIAMPELRRIGGRRPNPVISALRFICGMEIELSEEVEVSYDGRVCNAAYRYLRQKEEAPT